MNIKKLMIYILFKWKKYFLRGIIYFPEEFIFSSTFLCFLEEYYILKRNIIFSRGIL
jgi:hypothetical protein